MLHYIAGKRLAAGRLTVVDATSVQPEARAALVALAREHDVLPVAIVLDLPEAVCAARNAQRPDRAFGPHVIRRQHQQLRRSLREPAARGLPRPCTCCGPQDEVAEAVITRTPLFSDLRHETGPFDVIGDVHGCRAELETLLEQARLPAGAGRRRPGGERGAPRRAAAPIFLGDLVDRGPDSPGVLRLAMGMVAAGHRAGRAGQPRGQAAARAARAEGAGLARARDDAGAARGRAAGVPRRRSRRSLTA